MLKKLIKHEFIATGRNFLPLYALTIILTPVLGLIFRFGAFLNDNIVTDIMCGFGIVGFIFAMFALFIASTIFIIIRFYRTTATAEAYLTFTLPAKPSQILGSKLLVASIWQLLSFIIAIVTIFSMLYISGLFTIEGTTEFFNMVGNALSEHEDISNVLPVSIACTTLTMLLGIPSGILSYYCAIMLGQLFNEHRVIASFGIYIALGTVMQIVGMAISVPLAITNSATAIYSDSTGISALEFFLSYNVSATLGACLCLVLGIACYIVTLWVMKKKLNVR